MDTFITSLITASSIVFSFLISFFFKELENLRQAKRERLKKYKELQKKLDAFRVLCHCLKYSECLSPYKNQLNEKYVCDERDGFPQSFVISIYYISRGLRSNNKDLNSLEEEYNLIDLQRINECCYCISLVSLKII